MVGWFWRLAELVWPAECLGCGAAGTWWCASCDAAVVLITNPTCPRCNRLSPAGRYCGACRRNTDLTGVLAGAHYREPLPKAIYGLKYRSAKAVAPRLAGYQLCALARLPRLQNAVLVPVPLHWSRLRARGHNQSALLAEVLGKAAGLPLNTSLKRIRPTRSQTGLNRTHRRANVRGAFRWTGRSLRGRKVVLVDDVLTTGATLNAAAAAVRAAGARGVWGLVVAKR